MGVTVPPGALLHLPRRAPRARRTLPAHTGAVLQFQALPPTSLEEWRVSRTPSPHGRFCTCHECCPRSAA